MLFLNLVDLKEFVRIKGKVLHKSVVLKKRDKTSLGQDFPGWVQLSQVTEKCNEGGGGGRCAGSCFPEEGSCRSGGGGSDNSLRG